MKYTANTCKFVELSNLVPSSCTPEFYVRISENAPFSWGDNNRTLIAPGDLAEYIEEVFFTHEYKEDVEGMPEADVRKIIQDLKEINNDNDAFPGTEEFVYIDLEN